MDYLLVCFFSLQKLHWISPNHQLDDPILELQYLKSKELKFRFSACTQWLVENYKD